MVQRNLFDGLDAEIKMQILSDFVRLSQFFQEDTDQFYRLGVLHSMIGSVHGDGKVLDYLGQKLHLGEYSLKLLKNSARQGFRFLREISDMLVEYAARSLDVKVIECITANELGVTAKKKLESGLGKIFKPSPMISYKTDKTLVGGSVLNIDYIRFDSSYLRYFKKIGSDCVSRMCGKS